MGNDIPVPLTQIWNDALCYSPYKLIFIYSQLAQMIGSTYALFYNVHNVYKIRFTSYLL